MGRLVDPQPRKPSWRKMCKKIAHICIHYGEQRGGGRNHGSASFSSSFEDERIILSYYQWEFQRHYHVLLKTDNCSRVCVFDAETAFYVFGLQAFRQGRWIKYIDALYAKSLKKEAQEKAKRKRERSESRIVNFSDIDDSSLFGDEYK